MKAVHSSANNQTVVRSPSHLQLMPAIVDKYSYFQKVDLWGCKAFLTRIQVVWI